jgi:hypothetical protein
VGVSANLVAQGVQGRGVTLVDAGAFGVGRQIAEDVAQVEDREVGQVQFPYESSHFV